MYEVWEYYNKFDSAKSLGAYFWYACCNASVWSMDYPIFCFMFKNILGGLFWNPAGSRRAARGAGISETRLLINDIDIFFVTSDS